MDIKSIIDKTGRFSKKNIYDRSLARHVLSGHDNGVQSFDSGVSSFSDDEFPIQLTPEERFSVSSNYIKKLIDSKIGKQFKIDGDTRNEELLDHLDTIYGFEGYYDMTNMYNSKLSDEKYLEYLGWKKNLPERFASEYDYDLQGFFSDKEALNAFNEEFLIDPDSAHMPDTYKKPNHPTFSHESAWNGVDGMFGGRWSKDGTEYFASNVNIAFNGTRNIINYLGGRSNEGGIRAVFYNEDKLTPEMANMYKSSIDKMFNDIYTPKPQEPVEERNEFDYELMKIYEDLKLLD